MEQPYFPTEIEARRELARVGLISKKHYRPQMIQFEVLDDPHWQANIEEKQGRFCLDFYRTFSFQHRSMVYNPRDNNLIPNARDNPHTPGWSHQLTNVTLTYDVASEHMYYGKVRIKFDLERGHCPPNHAIKATVFGNPKTTAVLLMLEDHTHV